MSSAQVFISYRRDDSAGYARAIYDAVSRTFGHERVFIDVDDILPGLPFVDVLKQAVGAAPVLLVLIGPRWQGQRDGAPPRLHDAGDMVRHEVATGLRSGARLIPVLLDGTPMPSAAQLPDDLQDLPGRNALELSATRYAADMQRLLHTLRQTLEPDRADNADGADSPDSPDSASMAHGAGNAHSRGSAGTAGSARNTGAANTAGGAGNSKPAVAAAAAAAAAASGRAPAQQPQRRLAVLAVLAVTGAAAAGVVSAVLWWRGGSPPAVAGAAVDGTWQADVTYDWPGARHSEQLVLRSQGGVLHGSASFLGVPRGLLEGRVDAGGLAFSTHTSEVLGDSSRVTQHHYRGRWDGDTLRFVMQTEGASTPHAPVEFVARRQALP
jgi:hypothetical protein